MTVEKIHARKGLAMCEKILDYMVSEELVVNLFRVSRTESKLRREDIQGATAANKSRYVVGREVRAAIERVGGTMPEYLPVTEKSISQVEKEQLPALKEQAKKKPLMLDE
jgi:DNA-damage-inducible protein D